MKSHCKAMQGGQVCDSKRRICIFLLISGTVMLSQAGSSPPAHEPTQTV